MAYGLADVVLQRRFITESAGDPEFQRAAQARLDAMLALCETSECRRSNMLAYFGETTGACGNCDTCLTPPETWDGTVPAQKLLSTLVRLDRERGQHYGAGQLIDILRGTKTARVAQHHHDTLSTWGIGADLSSGEWRAVVRQLLARGDLAIGPGGHGILVTTTRSWEVLRGERPVPLRRDLPRPSARTAGPSPLDDAVARPGEPGTSPGRKRRSATGTGRGSASRLQNGDLTEAQAHLFEALRTWRSATARAKSVPAYVIFHDATLRMLATLLPNSLEALADIPGIGRAKLEAYGEDVLAILRKETEAQE
jgi:ATP-dependent DNA helicase RecQ